MDYYTRNALLFQLATHAPAPPEWFQAELPPCPPARFVANEPAPDDEIESTDNPNLAEYHWGREGYYDANDAARATWRAEKDRQRLFQWPWAYAAGVLAAHPPFDAPEPMPY